jgi:hypothetical protein
VSDGGQLVGVPTIINKLTTNTVEIASIRIYATELQSLVEIARLVSSPGIGRSVSVALNGSAPTSSDVSLIGVG